MAYSTNELSRQLFCLYATETLDKSNAVMGTSAVIKGCLALYYTAAEEKKFVENYSFPSTITGISLLSRAGYVGKLNQQFKDNIQGHFLHTLVKRGSNPKSIVREINEWFAMDTDGKIDDMVNEKDIENLNESKPVALYVRSTFYGEWMFWFDDEMRKEKFHLPGSDTTMVKMMNNSEIRRVLVSDMEKELEATVVQLPYQHDKGCFIAIMPDKPSDKEDLVKLLSSLNLPNLLNSFSKNVTCSTLKMPKFTTETNLMLDGLNSKPEEGLGRIEALKDLKKKAPNYFSNIIDGGIRNGELGVSFNLKTTIENYTRGMDIITDCGVEYSDCLPEDTREIVFDKPMLYLVVDRNGYIIIIGTLVKPE